MGGAVWPGPFPGCRSGWVATLPFMGRGPFTLSHRVQNPVFIRLLTASSGESFGRPLRTNSRGLLPSASLALLGFTKGTDSWDLGWLGTLVTPTYWAAGIICVIVSFKV